jgi:hypothetical protein
MNPPYHARIGVFGGAVQTIQVDEPDDWQAICTAFGASTPFGHSLWNGRRFLGYFEAGDLRAEPWGALRDLPRRADRAGA